jgi:tryptophan synthase beta subunit
MTPEEIITRFKSGFLADRPTMSSSKAIEAIKQYAKQMCDKQKDECVMAVSRFGNKDIEEACGDALYPSELQD